MCKGYRDDEEMYVYDQCCSNCANHGSCNCPMYIDEDEKDEEKIAKVEKRKKEDAIVHGESLDWCIYWKQRGGRHR